jgi:soluble lytic murein transglycosylase
VTIKTFPLPLLMAALILAPMLCVPMAVLVIGPAAAATAVETAANKAWAGIPHPPPPRRPALGTLRGPMAGKLDPVFKAVELRQWSKAYAMAAPLNEPVLPQVIDWIRFTTPGERMGFEEVTAFITAHPDWPNKRALRRSAEEALADRVSDTQVIAWFDKHPPLTPKGVIQLVDALIQSGHRARATTYLRQAWVEKNFSAVMERAFYRRYRRMLTAGDHEKRIDRLLWDGRGWEARRTLRHIRTPYKFVALARMRLRAYRGGADWAIRRIPEHMITDPGLIFERLRWRRRKGRDDQAIELLAQLPKTLARPELLWRDQGILARRALRKGNITLAYKLASEHRQIEGESFADAEWLAGFIALRFLKEPKDALNHFIRLYEKVNFPVSRARGAYWAGRAARDLGRNDATDWFARAAGHVTTYYGQLAVLELGGKALSQPIPPAPKVAEKIAVAFSQNELARAAELIAASRERGHFKTFVRHLARTAKTPADHALASAIAIAANRPDVAVWAAKESLKQGVHLINAGWPRGPLPENRRGLEQGILLALMRQESAFDVQAVSWAGARGLMQVMPATARKVAKRIGLPFSRQRLLNDAKYNMTIGTAYFAHILEQFSGSYVLALASYNAGPGRARRWLRQNGDFRAGEVDAVDWIEMIPFEQTRDYVQRVIENVQIYRALYNGDRMRIIHPGVIKG